MCIHWRGRKLTVKRIKNNLKRKALMMCKKGNINKEKTTPELRILVSKLKKLDSSLKEMKFLLQK